MLLSNNIKQFFICITSASAGFIVTKLITDYYYNKPYKDISNYNHNNIKQKNITEELLREELKRNYEFFGNESMASLRNSSVIIIGVGSLGSHVVMALLRSGIKHIKIIDKGIITSQSLSSNAFASYSDIGRYKVDIIKSYAALINPQIKVDAIHQEFSMRSEMTMIYDTNNEDIVPDYIIDCLGECKAELKSHLINLITCDLYKEKNVKVMSCLDFKGRYDPSMIRVVPFSLVSNNPYANIIRKMHKDKLDKAIPNIDTVYSIEEVNDNNKVRNHRNSSYSCLPAAFAQCLASKIICNLAHFNDETKQNDTNELPAKETKKKEGKTDKQSNTNQNKRGLEKLIADFEKTTNTNNTITNTITPYDQQLFTYDHYDIIMKSFNYQSSITQKKNQKLRLVLWRPFNQKTIDNIIIGTKDEVIKHSTIKSEEELIAAYPKATIERIEEVLCSIRTNYANK